MAPARSMPEPEVPGELALRRLRATSRVTRLAVSSASLRSVLARLTEVKFSIAVRTAPSTTMEIASPASISTSEKPRSSCTTRCPLRRSLIP